jgi:hypothetical protein
VAVAEESDARVTNPRHFTRVRGADRDAALARRGRCFWSLQRLDALGEEVDVVRLEEDAAGRTGKGRGLKEAVQVFLGPVNQLPIEHVVHEADDERVLEVVDEANTVD